MRATGIAAGLGCSIVATVVICIIGGLLLDREFGTEPWLTLAGVGIAIVAAGYQLYELSTIGRPGSKPGLVTRNIERVMPSGQGRIEPSENGTDRSQSGSRDLE